MSRQFGMNKLKPSVGVSKIIHNSDQSARYNKENQIKLKTKQKSTHFITECNDIVGHSHYQNVYCSYQIHRQPFSIKRESDFVL